MTGESREQFLQRPSVIVSLLAGLVGIATGVLTLTGALSGGTNDRTTTTLSPATSSSTSPALDTASARIDACMKGHGLAQTIQKDTIATGRILVRQCVWPPPVGAAPDGYTQIALAIDSGPGRSEAEGLTVANLFSSECQNIELSYLFNNQGTFTPSRPFRVSKGEIRRVEDGSVWRPRSDAEASTYSARRDQFIVLSNMRYQFDTARCV